MIRSHLIHLVIQAGILAVFFALLLHTQKSKQRNFGVKLFAGLVLGTIVLAAIMVPFPG